MENRIKESWTTKIEGSSGEWSYKNSRMVLCCYWNNSAPNVLGPVGFCSKLKSWKVSYLFIPEGGAWSMATRDWPQGSTRPHAVSPFPAVPFLYHVFSAVERLSFYSRSIIQQLSPMLFATLLRYISHTRKLSEHSQMTAAISTI